MRSSLDLGHFIVHYTSSSELWMTAWRCSIDNHEVVGSVLLDLSRAFDSVNHRLLLQKLSLYGFRGGSLEWFASYLNGRQQCVAYGEELSERVIVKMGVPQGSILGPLLFTIFC